MVGTRWTMPTAAWIAQSYPRASSMLLNGNEEGARKMLMVEKNSALPPKPSRKGEIRRELDKTHRILPPA